MRFEIPDRTVVTARPQGATATQRFPSLSSPALTVLNPASSCGSTRNVSGGLAALWPGKSVGTSGLTIDHVIGKAEVARRTNEDYTRTLTQIREINF